ncbi:hypothetical protein chiPu_0008213 [Chiloscyllium punctatum]|uniref:Uncharacterized protein n=1 Tax=Chiloscyllium punctatum TaxID=137246 RepID=A0A401SH97_CHIPU|nr:hypothetical protein [Chiloscyllium punctatum]
MPTTRSTSVFTRKPLTTKRSELISNIMIEQDSASYLDKEIKSMHEPTKPGNEIINLSKGSTIMNPTNFRLLENIMEENTVVTEVSSTMDPNLKTDTSEKSTVTKKLVSSRVKDRPPQATFYDQSVRTNPNSLNKEGTVPAIPKISQSFAPSNVITMDPDNSDNAATVKSLTPEEIETMLPNLNKAGRTASTPDIDPDVANKDTAWTTISSIFVTMYSELVQSFAPNRSITVNPDNSDDGETIKPMAEEFATNIPKLDKGGTRSTVPEGKTSGFKILDKEGTTKPFTPEEAIMDSKSLNKVTIAQPTVTEVKIKDSKMLSKEKVTMSPVDEDGTKGSQPVEKEGTTKAAVPGDSSIDSKFSHIEATTKSTIAEDDTVTFEPLDNGSTKDMTSEGSVTIFHKSTQFFDSNRDIRVHSDNATKIQPIPPEDITVITPYLNREGTTNQLAPEGSGTMDSNKSDEEIPTTVPEKYQTTFTEIAQTVSLSTASIFELENLEIASTLLPIPSEEALTELPNKEQGTTKHPVPDDGAAVSKVFDKEGTVKATIVEDNALNSESSDSEEMEATVLAGRTTRHPEITRSFAANTATSVDSHKLDNLATIQPTPEEGAPILLDLSKVRKTQPSVESASSLKSNTLGEAETTFPKMEKEGTIKPTVPEDTTDSKTLNQDNKTKSNVPEKEHIIDSNVFDKEAKTTFTIMEHGALNSESLDHEETTIVPKESTMEFKIIDGEESTKVPVPEYAPMNSKSFGKEGTKKTTSEGSSSMDSDKVGIKEIQTTFTEKHTTTYPEISETLAPIRATALAKLENATTVQPINSKESVTILPNLPKEETAKLSSSEEHIMDSRSSDKEVIIKPTFSEDNNTDSKSLGEEKLTMATVKADSMIESKFVEQDRTTKYTVPEEVSSTNSKVFDTDGITNSPIDKDDTIHFESLDNERTKSTVPKDHSSNSKMMYNEGLTMAYDPDYSSMDSKSLEKEGITKPHVIEDGSMVKEAKTLPSTPDEGRTKTKSLYKEVTTKFMFPEDDVTTDSYFSDKGGPTKPTVTEHGTMISESLDNEEIHTTASGQFITTHPKIPESLAPYRAVTVDPDNLNYAGTIQTENAATMFSHKDGTSKVPEESETTLSDNSDREQMQTSVPEEHATMYFEVSQSVAPVSLGPDNLENTTTIQPISSVQPVTILSKLTKAATANLFTPEDDTLDLKSSDKEVTTKPIIPSDGTIKSKSTHGDRTTNHPVQDDDSTDSNVLVRDRTTNSPPDEDSTTNSETLDNEETKSAVPEDTSTDSKISDNEGLTKAYDVQYSSTDFTSLEKEGITKPHVIEDGSMMKTTTQPSTPDEGTTKSKSQYKKVTTKSTVPKEGGTTDSYFSDKGGPIKPTVTEDGTMISESLDNEEIHTTASGQFIATHPEIPQSLAPYRAVTVDPDNLNYAETIQTIASENAVTIVTHKDKKKTTKVRGVSEATLSDNSDKEEMQASVPEEHATMYFEVSQSVAPVSLGPDNFENTTTIQPISSVQSVTILSKLTKAATANLFNLEDDTLDSKSSDKEATTKPIITSDGTIKSKSLDKDRTTKHTVQDDDSTDSNILDKDGTTNSPPDEVGTTNSETLDNEETKPGVPENTSSDSKISDNEGLTKAYDRDYSLMDFTSLEKGRITKPHVTEDGSMMKEATTQLSTPDEGTTKSKSLFKEVTMKFTVQEDGTIDPYFSDKERPTKPTVTQHNTKISESFDNEEIHTTAFGQFPAIHPEIQHSLDPNRAVTVDSDNLNNAETATTNPTIPENNNTDPKSLDKEESMKSTVTDNDTIQSKSVDEDRTTKHTILEDDFTDSNILDRDGTINSLTAEDGNINSEILDHEGAKTTVPEDTIPLKIFGNEGLTKAYNPEYSLLDSKSLDKEEITKPGIIEDGSMGKEATTQPSIPDEATTKSISLHKEVTTKSTVPEEDGTTDSSFSDQDRPTKSTVPEHDTMISESLDNKEIHTTASGRFIATHTEIQQSLDSNRAVTVDSDNLNNAGTIQTENAATIFPHKEGTTKVAERSETTVSDNLDKEMQTSVPKKYPTTYFETSTSYALIRTTFLSPGNLENATTIKSYGLITSVEPPIIPNLTEETTHLFTPAEDILDSKSPDEEGTTKPSTSEEANNIDSKNLNKGEITKASGGMTESATVAQYRIAKPTIPEEGDNKERTVLDNEEVSKPVVIEYDSMISETLDNEETKCTVHEDTTADSKTKPIVHNDNITDLKILDREKMTMDPATINSKPLEKKWTTKSIGLEEDGTTDSQFFDKAGKIKPSFAKDSTIITESLYKEEIQTITSLGFTAKYPGVSQTFVPNRAAIVDPDNLDNAETMQLIVPEDAASILPHKDIEGTTKPLPEGSATMSSLDIVKGEKQTTFPEKHATTHHEVSRSFALIRATSLGLDNLDKITTIKPNTFEKAQTMLQQPDKDGMTNPTVLEEHYSTESKVLDRESTTKTTTAEDGALNSESLGNEEAKPEESTTDFKILDNRQLTKVSLPECGTMESKSFNKEGTTKPTVSERSITMGSDEAGKEEIHTTVPKKCVTVHPAISQTFAPNRAMSLSPSNLDDATIQLISRKERVTILPNLNKEGTTKLSTPGIHTIHSNTSNKYNNTDSKILHKEETTMTTSNDVGMNESKSVKQGGTTKSTISEQTASLNSDGEDKKTMQTAAPEKSATTFLEISQTFSPNGGNTLGPDMLGNTATKQPITLEEAVTTLPNPDQEKITKLIVSEDFTEFSENLNIAGSTKPTIAEDGTLKSESLVNVETKTISPEESANVLLNFTESFVPNRTVTVQPDNLDNAVTVQSIPTQKSVIILPYLGKIGTSRSAAPEEGSLNSTPLEREGTTNSTVLSSSTIYLSSLQDKEQSQPTLQDAHSIKSDTGIVKDGITRFTEAAEPDRAPTLNKTSTTQINVLEGIITFQPANLEIEGTTKTKKSITIGLNLKTETEKMIDLDKYTGKYSNVTTPAYLPQSRHDSKVTMVTKLSEAFRNQTTTTADHLNDPNLCDKRPSDALTTIQNGTTYIFRGHLFWTIDPNGPSLGHPRRISEVWGIPSPIDTVFTRCNCNGKTFFFKGEQYWRFQNGVMDSGYPRLITSGFSGLNGKIRAALSVAAHKNRPETVYFFKNGGRYQKYVYQQRVSTTCTQRSGARANFVLRRRFKRKTLVIKTIRSQKSDITLTQESAARRVGFIKCDHPESKIAEISTNWSEDNHHSKLIYAIVG